MRLPAVDTFSIDSDHLDGERLEASVALLPGGAGGKDTAVVYVLDPQFNFAIAAAAAGWLGTASRLAGGDFPAVAVVGVGYPTADLRELMARRARDLTPTDGPPPPGIDLPPFPYGTGGAARFLEALTDEVVPMVERRLPGATRRVLVGHSFGGLFTLFALLERPGAFGRHLAISPSIWWDDGAILRLERQRARQDDDLPAHAFVAVGACEQAPGAGWLNEGFPDEAIAAAGMVDGVRGLCRALEGRDYPGLRLDWVVLDDEHHLTIQPAAVTRGLLRLLSAARPSRAPASDGGDHRPWPVGRGSTAGSVPPSR